MSVIQVCMKHPYLRKFVPETDWYSSKSLTRMLKKHRVVYLKPNKGLQGQGVIRIKRLSKNTYEMTSGARISMLKKKALMKHVYREISSYPDYYLVQQGIDLATYQKRPFDVRLLLIKHTGMWRLTMTCVRAAAYKNSPVTNVSYNIKLKPIEELQFPLTKVLRETDQPLNSITTLRELIDLSYQVVKTLGRHFPVSILGLDFVLDKRGKIWFIEANTNPEVEALRQINKEKDYQRFVQAKRQITIIQPN